jgi:hypothetical protein
MIEGVCGVAIKGVEANVEIELDGLELVFRIESTSRRRWKS